MHVFIRIHLKATSSGSWGLPLALCSEITPGLTMCNVRDQTSVYCVQDQCLTPRKVSPTPK